MGYEDINGIIIDMAISRVQSIDSMYGVCFMLWGAIKGRVIDFSEDEMRRWIAKNRKGVFSKDGTKVHGVTVIIE